MSQASHYSLSTLRERLRPFRLRWIPTVGSTNTWAARARRKKQLFAPSVVLAGRQTQGRGRGRNRFVSPPGVMTATFVIRANDSIPPNLVPLFAGLATRDAIYRVSAVEAGLKWPNDIYYKDRKLAGMLCERVDGVDLIGIGLNVNLRLSDLPPSLRRKSVSLKSLLNVSVDISAMVVELAHQLTRRLVHPEHSNQAALREYSRLNILTERHIRIEEDGKVISGRCQGIDQHGRLIISNGTRRQTVVSGSPLLVEPLWRNRVENALPK